MFVKYKYIELPALLSIDACRLHSEQCLIVKRQADEGGVFYKKAFKGRALVDWMIYNQEVITRGEAVIEGKLLLQNDVLRHGKKR